MVPSYKLVGVGMYEWIGVFLIFLLATGFTFAVALKGIARTFYASLATVIAAAAISFVVHVPVQQHLVTDLVVVGCGLGIGSLGGFAYRYKTTVRIKDAIYLRYSAVMEDYRILVVLISVVSAGAVTLFFAKMRASEVVERGFWHGFYEAWTASLAFFLILGLAGTIVSFYRPEKDTFETKIRILCGGRIGTEVDYIRAIITKFGYFCESVTRTYTVKSWDSVRRAYEIEVTHETVNMNFFGENSHDHGGFKIIPDELNPPLDPVGTLIEVKVGDRLVCDAMPIPVAGLTKTWNMELPKGKTIRTVVRHKLWYQSDVTHNFTPPRFIKVLHTHIISEIPGASIPYSWTTYHEDVTDFHILGGGLPKHGDGTLKASVLCAVAEPVKNCIPSERAISLKFEKPGNSPGRPCHT
jgi:hypothetical protein